MQLQRQNMPSPLRRRGGGCNWHVPPPTLTCLGPRQAPRARESQAASREAGGRQADGLARRRLGLAAGRRASCRGRENGGAPGPAALRARLLYVYRAHSHLPRPTPAEYLSPARLRSLNHKGGGTRHLGVPDTRIPPPKSRALGADPPARAYTHTPGTFGTSDRHGSVPHPTHTHSLWVLRAASPPAKLPTRNPHAHSSFSNLISPGTRSFPPHS